MVANNPMRGLIMLTYFKTRGKVWGAIIYSLVLGIAFLVGETEMLKNMFIMASMVYLPLQVLVGMSENEGRWERFQVSLPIKRSYLLNAQYLSLIFAGLAGGIILTAGIGISAAIHEQWLNNGFASAILSSLHSYGLAFMAIGLCYMLSFVVGNFAAWIIAMLAPTILQFTLPDIAERMGVSIYILSASVFISSAAIFIISYFIMKTVYGKYDF